MQVPLPYVYIRQTPGKRPGIWNKVEGICGPVHVLSLSFPIVTVEHVYHHAFV
jgi:hypothetical protein